MARLSTAPVSVAGRSVAGRDVRLPSDGVILEPDQALAAPANREARFRRSFHLVLVVAVLLDLTAQALGLVPQGSSWALLAIIGSVGVVVLLASGRAAHRRGHEQKRHVD
jgi:hypothetical protein